MAASTPNGDDLQRLLVIKTKKKRAPPYVHVFRFTKSVYNEQKKNLPPRILEIIISFCVISSADNRGHRSE